MVELSTLKYVKYHDLVATEQLSISPLSTFRYMNRLAKHVAIKKDDIFKDFLENPSEVQQHS